MRSLQTPGMRLPRKLEHSWKVSEMEGYNCGMSEVGNSCVSEVLRVDFKPEQSLKANSAQEQFSNGATSCVRTLK